MCTILLSMKFTNFYKSYDKEKKCFLHFKKLINYLKNNYVYNCNIRQANKKKTLQIFTKIKMTN